VECEGKNLAELKICIVKPLPAYFRSKRMQRFDAEGPGYNDFESHQNNMPERTL
jgi:hypothetical protein